VIGALAAVSHPLTESQLIGIAFGYVTTTLIAVGGYAINDVFDVEIDRINMPHRPIPAGYLTLFQAKIYSILLFISGVTIALLIPTNDGNPNFIAFFIAFTGGVLLYLYAAFLKRSGFIGNVMIGFLTAIPFIFGGSLTESYDTMIYPTFFAFLLIVGREIIKDIEDVHGDKVENVQSIALRYGVKPARNLGILILTLLILFNPIPIFLGYYSSVIFIIAVLIIDIAIFFVGYLLFNRTDDLIIANATVSKRILKSCIFLGILAFLLEGLLKLASFTL
jgi:geranylgeranylglycerol-phosphate geranylgeranyltransferase